MNVSSSHGKFSVPIDTDQKTVHKSDVDNLARSIKTVLQSSSKLVKELKSQKLSANQQITNMSDSKTTRQALSDKLVEVKSWKGELGRSSYEHAGFKEEKLDSLAIKIELDINSLRRAETFCVAKNAFLAKLQEVRSEGAVKDFKLDLDDEGKFGRVPR
jgi:septal ring factor EnvC (AmiA/AmiB activator)